MTFSKSILVESIFSQGMSWECPVVVLDFPKEDKCSTFNDIAKFLEEPGAYFKISSQGYQGDSFIKKSSRRKSWMTNQTFE